MIDEVGRCWKSEREIRERERERERERKPCLRNTQTEQMSSRGSTPTRDADIGTPERAASPGVRLQHSDTRLRTEVWERDWDFLWSGFTVHTQKEGQKTITVLLQSSWSLFPHTQMRSCIHSWRQRCTGMPRIWTCDDHGEHVYG